MNPLTVAILPLYFLVLVQSAPVGPSSPSWAFRVAAEKAKTLVEKILGSIPTVHSAVITTEGFTLDPAAQATNLQMMEATLGLPAAPVLKPLSERFTLDVCLSRMAAGSQMYQGLMGVLSGRLGGLSDLQVDLRDLQTHLIKMKAVAQLDGGVAEPSPNLDLASRLHGNYEVQVAAHLILTQLRSFCHDLIRSLRAVNARMG